MKLKTTQIQVSDHELQDPEKRTAFIKTCGVGAYRDALAHFARQRLGPERVAGFSRRDLGRLDQKTYEKHRDKIRKDLASAERDPKKPVYACVDSTRVLEGGWAAWDTFGKHFGEQRLFEALDLDGLQNLNDKTYHKVLGREFIPYTTGDKKK